MAVGQLSTVIQQLRCLLNEGVAAATDESLLESFLKQRDEAAFEALVRRHGPMVLGVCRRILGNDHDAEDAFQAAFLVLVRKAASIRPKSMVGNWLYGVACRTALDARKAAAKRRAKEAAVLPRIQQPADHDRIDLLADLDEELQRLPPKCRAVIVLSDLEGKTRKEVARHLGWPEGSVASRLARARARLAKRLARYGLAVSGGSLRTLLPEGAASASVPPSWLASTVKAASLLAAGQAAAGAIPAPVAALTEGMMSAMLMSKLKTTMGVLLVIALLGVASVLALPLLSQNEKEAAAQSATADRKQMSHDAIVRCVAFSPDGKTLASGADDKTIKLWDVATGEEQATLKGHTDWVWSLTYSPDGKTLASVSKDTTIKLWDVATGREWATLPGHTEWQCSVAFSPDGKTLAEGSKDRTVKLWDVQTAKVRATLKWKKDWLAEQVAPLPKEEVAVAFSPDGKTLASGNVDKTIKLWDVATGKERATLNDHVGRLTYLVFSPDGKTLASAGGPINLWDVETGKQRAVLKGATSLAFSPDSKTLISAGQGEGMTLWDVQAGKEQATLTVQTDWVTSVAFSPTGRMFASSSRHYLAADKWLGKIKLWDVASGQEEEIKTDLDRVQGTWRVVSSQVGGEKASEDEVRKRTVTVKGNVMTYDYGTGDPKQVGTIKLDPKTKYLDWNITSPEAGTTLALYEIKGDEWKIGFGNDGVFRPRSWAIGKDDVVWLLVLKREQPSQVDKKKAEGSEETPLQKEWRRLEGTWKPVAYESDGEKVEGEAFQTSEIAGRVLTIEEGKYRLTSKDGPPQEAKLTINPTAKPKRMELTVTLDGKTQVGRSIYELDGDTLRICTNFENAQVPPKGFTAKGSYVMVDKRQKGLPNAKSLNHSNEAFAALTHGDYDKAVAEATEAIRLDSENVMAHLNRGSAYVLKGEPDKAIKDFDRVIQLEPKEVRGYDNRAAAYAAKGDYRKAVEDYREAMQVGPGKYEPNAYLADLLATCPDRDLRDGKKAVELATRACELTRWNDCDSLSALAAASGEVADFKKAVEWQKKAMKANGTLAYKTKQQEEESRQRLRTWS